MLPPGLRKRSRARRKVSTCAPSAVAANEMYHPLVKQHNANGLRDDRVNLSRLHNVFLDLLVLDHALHHADSVAQMRVGLALVGLINELES